MVKRIPLNGKYGQGKFALVDDLDFDRVSKHSWCVLSNGYAVATIDTKFTYMHRFVVSATKGKSIDHVDGDPLNNQRQNLRYATARQQLMNTRKRKGARSVFKGVMLVMNRWEARISIGKGSTGLGRFLTQREAAKAYNDAAIKYFGRFAKLNDLSILPPEKDKPLDGRTPRSKYKGVYFDKKTQKWASGIMVNRQRYRLGYFASQIEAARAYDAEAKRHHLFDRLNFPDPLHRYPIDTNDD